MTCMPFAPFGPAHSGSPAVRRRVLGSTLDTWTAIVRGSLAYWAGAVTRGAGPWDVAGDGARWLELTTQRSRPGWAHPNEVVLRGDIARLRDFSTPGATHVVPTVVLPPQAGHDSCIVDYSVRQSQLEVLRAAGLQRLYSLDWLGATRETRDAGIADYLAFLERAMEHVGGRVNLVGDCQGGWLAAVYAALHPDQINTLTLAGAPIDFHAGGAVIDDYVKMLDVSGDLGFYDRVVAMGDGVMRGEFMLGGFLAIKPDSEVSRQLELLAHLDDPEYVARYRAFENWFKHTQDIPGELYLWIVERLFRDNALVRGDLVIDGERVDLRRIGCPLHLLAGEADHITPPAQVFAAAEHVGTPVGDITRRTTSGGHLGLFMGREALRDHWPPILAGVYERSRIG
ncbi:MAG: alpha/beta fold hydrolase [Actinomycetota bacterium]|nr:alpha/beta fold hydrolase [Actinomycetota bacterium]